MKNFEKSLFNELEKLKEFKNIHIDYNRIIGEKNAYFLKEDDGYFLKNYLSSLYICLCNFVVYDGSAVIPALNFIYEMKYSEEIDIKDYKLHHRTSLFL